MTTTSIPLSYITLDDNGTARIAGTGIKVRMLAEELRAGYRPEDIQEAHMELSMAQVYAALAYYHANKLLFDEMIDAGERSVNKIQSSAGSTMSRETLVKRMKGLSGGRKD